MSHKKRVLYETFRKLITEIFSCQWSKKNASFFHFRTYILFFKVRFEKKVGQFSCSSYPPLRFLDEKSSTPIEKKVQKKLNVPIFHQVWHLRIYPDVPSLSTIKVRNVSFPYRTPCIMTLKTFIMFAWILI